MSTVNTTAPAAAAATSPIKHASARDIFGELTNGGTIQVREWPGGELTEAAKRVSEDIEHTDKINAEYDTDRSQRNTALLIRVEDDGDDTSMDIVSTHPDEENKLALFDRAIEALHNARAALVATGWVDHSERQS